MTFTFKKLEIPDVVLIEPELFFDDRGHFYESFKESAFASNGIDVEFVQDNISHSVKGVLRGLHFQIPPKAQAKLVTAIKGKIFDVAVDIRKNSTTYGKWVSEILSEDNHNLLYVPKGFAHGFCVMTDQADVMYKVSSEYSPEDERGIIWNDHSICIEWPTFEPTVSTSDSQLPLLENLDDYFA